MKHYLILNPTSKSGKGKKRWEQIFDLLKKYEIDFEVGESTYSGHAIELAYNATISQQYQVIVAVGGDGTINEVLNGICSAKDKIHSLPALGILYTGTSPDICKYHNIPLNMEKAIKLLKSERSKIVDIGEIEHIWHGKMTTRYFLCSANLGIGAAVASGSNSGLRKYFGDTIGTMISIIKSVIAHKNSDFKCIIDGESKIFPKTLNMTVGKNPLVASGYKVGVDIKDDDGKAYIFSINNFSLPELLLNFHRIYTGTFHRHRKNTLMFFNEFHCENNTDAPQVEYDGDPQGYLPCSIRLFKNRLRIIK